MRYVIILVLLFVGLQAQTPVPMQNFTDITAVNGDWYIVWQFISNTPVSKHNLTGCSIWTIDVNSTGGVVWLYLDAGVTSNVSDTIKTIGNPNTVWNNFLYWLDAASDLSWALVAFNSTNKYIVPEVFLLSRTNSYSEDVINSCIELIKQQGFNPSFSDEVYWKNNECPRLEKK